MYRLITILTISLLVACTPIPSKKHDAIIDEIAEKDREMINHLADKSFVYKMTINDDSIEEIVLSIDFYEDGKLIETNQEFATHVSGQGDITFAYIQNVFQNKY